MARHLGVFGVCQQRQQFDAQGELWIFCSVVQRLSSLGAEQVRVQASTTAADALMQPPAADARPAVHTGVSICLPFLVCFRIAALQCCFFCFERLLAFSFGCRLADGLGEESEGPGSARRQAKLALASSHVQLVPPITSFRFIFAHFCRCCFFVSGLLFFCERTGRADGRSCRPLIRIRTMPHGHSPSRLLTRVMHCGPTATTMAASFS